jgi:hypothetical protein
LVYVGNVPMRVVIVTPPRYIDVLTMLLLRKPLDASLRRFPFGSLCSRATGTDLGSRPPKERYRGNHDHRPFAEAVEELPPILLISCGLSVRRSVLVLIVFHEETLLVEVNHVIVMSARLAFIKSLCLLAFIRVSMAGIPRP